jgi:capsular exopolysaccharide synthesis family protein
MKDLIVATNPKSSFAESIKLIKTNISFSAVDKELKTILLTSPVSGDGKSFVSANLASAFAQEGKNVLIVDADLRRGRQHTIFNLEKKKTAGYSGLILDASQNQADYNTKYKFKRKLLAQIHKTNVKGVSLLPAGATPPNPLELLQSDVNSAILKNLRECFDIIIIDCPPALGLSDTLIMTKYSDVNLVVISNSRTTTDQLRDVKKNFERVHAKISGVIINKVKVKRNAYSSYYTNNKYYTDNNLEK